MACTFRVRPFCGDAALGVTKGAQHVVLPLSFPERQPSDTRVLEDGWLAQPNGAAVLPIRTHLLCHLDDPVSIVAHYAGHLARKGDVVAIAESALAIMEVLPCPRSCQVASAHEHFISFPALSWHGISRRAVQNDEVSRGLRTTLFVAATSRAASGIRGPSGPAGWRGSSAGFSIQ